MRTVRLQPAPQRGLRCWLDKSHGITECSGKRAICHVHGCLCVCSDAYDYAMQIRRAANVKQEAYKSSTEWLNFNQACLNIVVSVVRSVFLSDGSCCSVMQLLIFCRLCGFLLILDDRYGAIAPTYPVEMPQTMQDNGYVTHSIGKDHFGWNKTAGEGVSHGYMVRVYY